MTKLRVAGVPEHFNLPLADLALLQPGLLDWREYSGGTGAMMTALERGEVDMALVLSEGAVARIARSGAAKVLAIWVETPLEWGIHVLADGRVLTPEEALRARIGISRYGSGSHLMPLVHARQADVDPGELRFVEVGNLQGAREAFAAGEIDTFYWERTMTLPLVESGEWARAGVFEAEWPAFVATVHADATQGTVSAARALLRRLRDDVCDWLADEDAVIDAVVRSHSLPEKEVRRWLSRTRWTPGAPFSRDAFNAIVDAELAAGILSERPVYEETVFPEA